MKRKDNTPAPIKFMQWLFPKLERWAPPLANRMFRLVFYVPAGYPVPDKEKEAEKSAEKFLIDLEGNRIQGYAWGDQAHPYVLVMHGWAGRATQFRKFIKPLVGAGFRVVGFDGPAHGRSAGTQTTILEFEGMLQEAFKILGEPVAVITHSFGGAAALYAAANGLPIKKLINIASPTIADEILKTYLRAINGSWPSAQKFKEFVKKRTGRSFEEFTALHSVTRLPHPVNLFLIHDENDKDVYLDHALELQKIYPAARLLKTSGLGHTRILKDDAVIGAAVDFIRNG